MLAFAVCASRIRSGSATLTRRNLGPAGWRKGGNYQRRRLYCGHKCQDFSL